jgi:hypothetical protein
MLALVGFAHGLHLGVHIAGWRALTAMVVLGPGGWDSRCGRAERDKGREGGVADYGSHVGFPGFQRGLDRTSHRQGNFGV